MNPQLTTDRLPVFILSHGGGCVNGLFHISVTKIQKFAARWVFRPGRSGSFPHPRNTPLLLAGTRRFFQFFRRLDAPLEDQHGCLHRGVDVCGYTAEVRAAAPVRLIDHGWCIRVDSALYLCAPMAAGRSVQLPLSLCQADVPGLVEQRQRSSNGSFP